ncbi:MAG TPA: hypothetical protein VG965_04935 [Patescibacteria group bacterium]|nr:hypothetical protein [Patescibacteria group bacterium]
MNKLFIDTRDNKKIVIRLSCGGREYVESSTAYEQKFQAALPLIQKVLQKAKIKANEINEIFVESSDGSFTGLRVGIAIANALSFALGIKVNEKNLGDLVLPEY